MAIAIPEPSNYQLTTNWWDIQKTNIHQFQVDISLEHDKLLKAHGRGSFFVIFGYKLGLFKVVINGKWTLMAQLTPGMHVHDFTVIDYKEILGAQAKKIYIKCFDEDDNPTPHKVYKIGSWYYHGTIGDGIDARPTYSILKCVKATDDLTNFRTFYRLTLSTAYGANGDAIDIPEINVDDFRFPPKDGDPTDPVDPWEPADSGEDEIDYYTSIARSQAIKWAYVLGKW